MISPFLAYYDNPYGTSYVSAYRFHQIVEGDNEPRITIATTKHAPQQVVSSAIEAEDRAIAAALARDPVPYRAIEHGFGDGVDGMILTVNINFASNLIAVATRRGGASIILMNPSDLPLLESSQSDAVVRLNRHDPQYRWTHYGRFNSFADIIVGEAVPPKRVILLYKGDGPHDCGAILSLHDGVQYLSLIDWDRYSNHLVIP